MATPLDGAKNAVRNELEQMIHDNPRFEDYREITQNMLNSCTSYETVAELHKRMLALKALFEKRKANEARNKEAR